MLADRVIVMDNAKVLLDGAPKEVFKNSQLLRDIGLDVPQVSYLSSRLKESGVDIDENILTNGEFVNSILEIIGDK